LKFFLESEKANLKMKELQKIRSPFSIEQISFSSTSRVHFYLSTVICRHELNVSQKKTKSFICKA